MSEKVIPKTEENREKCRCPDCPVYNACIKERNEKFFCAEGKTGCDIKKRGCLCLHCPIEIEYRLNSFFYCDKGSATKENVAERTLK